MTRRGLIHLAMIFLFFLSADALASEQVRSEFRPPAQNLSDGSQEPKILLLFESKYGSTKQYAEWMQQETQGKLVNLKTDSLPPFADYDIIVVGGYIRAGRIVVASFIMDHWDILKSKRVVLFTTSGTPPSHSNIRNIYEKSFLEAVRNRIAYFPLPGRISVNSLSFFDKLLITIGKVLEKDEALREEMGKDRDGVKRDNLSPLIEYINQIKKLVIIQQPHIQILPRQ